MRLGKQKLPSEHLESCCLVHHSCDIIPKFFYSPGLLFTFSSRFHWVFFFPGRSAQQPIIFSDFNLVKEYLRPLLIIVQPLISLPGSFCPSPILPTPGQPCNQLPGALDCHYENHIDYHGLAGNCCCGQCDMDMTCAPDSTNGSGLWQPKHPMLCPTEGCGSEGEWWRENIKEVDPLLKFKLINC